MGSSTNNGKNASYVGYNCGSYGLVTSNSGGTANHVSGLSFGSLNMYSIYTPSSSPNSITAQVNYGSAITSTSDMPTPPQPILLNDQANTGLTYTVQYIRERIAPPNNVMPNVNISPLSINPTQGPFTIAWMCCENTNSAWQSDINYYGGLPNHPVQYIAPQVYALNNTGNDVYLFDTSFNPSSDTQLATSDGLNVMPLVDAGDPGNSGGDSNNGLIALVRNPQTVGTELGKQLLAKANLYGFKEWQFDWETHGVNVSYYGPTLVTNMTQAIAAIASAMAPIRLSLTTIDDDFYQYNNHHEGPFNVTALAATGIAQINAQDPFNTTTSFSRLFDFMINYIPSNYQYKIQIGLYDGSSWNNPIAGYCLNQTLQYHIQSIAVWHTGGVIDDTTGYSDTYYQTNNWDSGTSSWFYYYLQHITS